MTKPQIQLAWKKVIEEVHKRPILGERLKNKNISQLGDLLLFTQILLNKIETGENIIFNELLYKKTINFYCTQMKKYV
jgi:hypothetical protein